jgi:hypothetical protein
LLFVSANRVGRVTSLITFKDAAFCVFCPGCPYSDLVEGAIAGRLSTYGKRYKLLSYLLSELQAVRMVILNKPHLIPAKTAKPESQVSFKVLL